MRCKSLALVFCVALFATAAAAHHPTGGVTPATFSHGLLSGLAHPLIGLDHLAFVVGIGVFASISGLGAALPLVFVACMAAGLALHLAAISIPAAELLIGLSGVGIGIAIMFGRTARNQGSRYWFAGVFALAGIVHGYAFAEAIVGAEQGVLAAYVTGLATVQLAIAMGAYVATRAIFDRERGQAPAVSRVAGLAILATGAVFAVRATGFVG
jgi:urease accessory protein